jgi:nifR3 family TIM-barrel protein
MNIWNTLKKPIMILAPMEDVTDSVFRQIIIDCGRPDLFFTEFTNVEGMASKKGNHIVTQRLQYTSQEKPLIAQIWGKDPKHYFEAAKKIVDMGFDGIDINMGCPEKSITKNGCCSALINNPSLASEIIKATQEGVRGEIPVSVKTRIGFTTIVTESWISFLLSHNLAAITVHGRTAKEMSAVPCHWDEIGNSVILRDHLKSDTLIIGNGDVFTLKDAQEKVAQYKVDGVMIGRGIFHNPFLFTGKEREDIPISVLIDTAKKHNALYGSTWGKQKNFAALKKFYKIYVQGFPGAQEMREKLMLTNSIEEAEQILCTINI